MTIRERDAEILRDEIAKAERDLERLRYATPKSIEHGRTIRGQIEAQERHIDRLRGMLT